MMKAKKLIPLIAIILVILISFLPPEGERFFNGAAFFFGTGAWDKFDISKHIVLVRGDVNTMERLALTPESRKWRYYDTLLIPLLKRSGAQIIAFDSHYDSTPTEWDRDLSLAAANAGNVITAKQTGVDYNSEIEKNLLCTGSGKVSLYRGIPYKILKEPNNNELSFAAEIVSRYKNPFGASFDVHKIPSSWLLNYRFPGNYFPSFSYAHVLDMKEGRLGDKKETPSGIFNNKITLITREGDHDRYAVNSRISAPGAFFHALGIETLLSRRLIRPFPKALLWCMNILLILFFQFILLKSGSALKWLLIPGLMLLQIIGGFILFYYTDILMPQRPFIVSSFFLIIASEFYNRLLIRKEWKKISREIKVLEQTNRMLFMEEEKQNILADTVVHDIKNAIATIENALSFISNKYKEDKQSLMVFKAAAVSCTDIINLSSNLLDIRRMEENMFSSQKELIEGETIISIIKKYTHFTQFKEKKIQVELPRGDFHFYSDVYLLTQILHNLLNNALKYTPRGGIIRLEMTNQKICLFNSSPPIPPEIRESLFQKYNRLGKGRSKYSKGLGLYFCKMAMELMEGEINLVVTPEGNSFCLTLTD